MSTPPALNHPLLTELVAFNYSVLGPRYRVPPHLHHFHQLDVVLEGQVQVVVEHQKPLLGEVGDAWLVPPLCNHGYTSRAGFRQGSFKFRLTPRFWSLFGDDFHTFRVSPHLIEEIETAGRRSRRHAALACQQAFAVASLCLIECLDQVGADTVSTDNLDALRHVLWPLLEHIEREPHAGWTVHRMAADCNLSPDYFSRCFHRILGLPPQRYVLEARMRAGAADLLTTPPRPIKEIADRAGYANVPAFNRAFKQVFQIGPAAYRHSPHEG